MKTAFTIIKWLFKTAFLIVGSFPVFRCGSSEEENTPVKFQGKVITDKDFIVLNDQFAKDSTTAYYKSRSFQYADIPTFEAVDDHYAKDKNKVYYCDEYREGQNYYLTKKQTILEIKSADPATFTSLGNGYAKDYKHAWLAGNSFDVKNVKSLTGINGYFVKDNISAYLNLKPIAGSHGKSFELIDQHFAKDNASIYYYGYTGEGQHNICILPCDRNTFEILDYRYSKDNQKVFFLGFTLKGADVASFELLEEDYSRDKNAVYFQSRKITNADPASFVVYEENGMFGHDFNYARDKSFVYMDDVQVTAADVKTFKVLGENYGSDYKHVFYKNKIVKGADPQSFNVYPHDFGDADAEDSTSKFHEGVKVTNEAVY